LTQKNPMPIIHDRNTSNTIKWKSERSVKLHFWKRGKRMTYIYSFLQKRKMHENQHGIMMVIVAYVLSMLLLALGSDVFYDINTKAAGISIEADEEAQYFLTNDSINLQNDNIESMTMNTQLINPYNLTVPSETDPSIATEKTMSFGEDTVWFLGSAMDNATFDIALGQMNNIVAESNHAVRVAASDKVIVITDKDIAILERIVEAEASGEDMTGKILIANVIFNRMASEKFPDTVEEVVFQNKDGDYQFSPVGSNRYRTVKISTNTVKAVQRAIDGEDFSKGALYFIARKRTSSTNAKWFDSNLQWLFKHGGHEFYKNK